MVVISWFDTPRLLAQAVYGSILGTVTDPQGAAVAGAKVTVKGNYGTTFTKSSTGAEADPFMGMLTFEEMTVAEPGAEISTLPGVKRKKK